MTADDLRHAWGPPWAPAVTGRYPDRVAGEDQRWTARCAACGGETEGRCASGRFRERIAQFALLHVHDPVR